MQLILVATDSDSVFDSVDAALADDDREIHRVRSGGEVRAAVLRDDPDLVILDLQIGAMGGIAACLDLRLEEGAERIPPQRIILLLDRDADEFLARRSEADGWLIKPLDAGRLHRAATVVLEGGEWYEPAREALS